jgi:hypothetical protein
MLMFLLLGWRILQQANIQPVFFGWSGLRGLSKIQTLLMATLIALPAITRRDHVPIRPDVKCGSITDIFPSLAFVLDQ